MCKHLFIMPLPMHTIQLLVKFFGTSNDCKRKSRPPTSLLVRLPAPVQAPYTCSLAKPTPPTPETGVPTKKLMKFTVYNTAPNNDGLLRLENATTLHPTSTNLCTESLRFLRNYYLLRAHHNRNHAPSTIPT